jgi:hypothetical protein
VLGLDAGPCRPAGAGRPVAPAAAYGERRQAGQGIERVSTADLVREFGRRVAVWLDRAAAAAAAGTARAPHIALAALARGIGAGALRLADAWATGRRALAARAAQQSARADTWNKEA